LDGGISSGKWAYVPALDGVRGIAVLLIVAVHTYTFLLPETSIFIDPVWSPVPNATFGVDMFFALSGFLITGLLLTEYRNTGGIGFRNFYIRRALRLLPALVALLIATTSYVLLMDEGVETHLKSVLPVLFYCGNWMPAAGVALSPLLLHTWSLSVEEQFYIVWPSLVAWWTIRRKRALGWLIIGLLCLTTTYRTIAWIRGDSAFLLYLNTFARADPLLYGALGAYLWATRPALRRPGLLGWPAVAMLVWLVCNHGIDTSLTQLIGWPLVGVATTMLVLALVNGWSGTKAFAWTPLRAVGRVSYGVYLWHAPVFLVVHVHGSSLTAPQRLLVGYAITTGLVLISWFCIERPFLAMKPRSAVKTAAAEQRVGARSPEPAWAPSRE
jgi:peptidoglycan/LPS O-acetylase OafA/YrhL